MKRIKGQDVNLFIDNKVVAASTSCTFTLNANTTDAVVKNDGSGAMWDNPDFTLYSWTMGNESFVLSTDSLLTLLDTIINGEAKVQVAFQYADYCLSGEAIISQFNIKAPNGENVTLSLSLEGSGELSRQSTLSPEISTGAKIKGKSLMVALKDNLSEYHTIAASTSHSLSVNIQTSEISTKDDNKTCIVREVTGKSITLTTENLLVLREGQEQGADCVNLIHTCMSGREYTIGFGYYNIDSGSVAGDDYDWGTPMPLLVYGQFLCSSININGAVKENATYTAEFVGKGKPYVGTDATV